MAWCDGRKRFAARPYAPQLPSNDLILCQGPGGEETDNKITVLTALTSTARATNTIWFAAQDAPKPRYQPDTNHPAPAPTRGAPDIELRDAALRHALSDDALRFVDVLAGRRVEGARRGALFVLALRLRRRRWRRRLGLLLAHYTRSIADSSGLAARSDRTFLAS